MQMFVRPLFFHDCMLMISPPRPPLSATWPENKKIGRRKAPRRELEKEYFEEKVEEEEAAEVKERPRVCLVSRGRVGW